MAAITPDVGTGTSIAFATSFLANLTNVNWSGISRPAVDTTHMGTTPARTFMPGDLYDPGSLSVEMQFDTDASPPITGAAETVTVTFPDAETWSASGFLTEFAFTAATEEVMTATATVKFTGTVTF